ncbi:MAG: hypothetical protein IT371_31455 [Deltaproteobacteria bacterium]|nr:hypothetical protein [Deltaproteobacteria bacterium]
MTCARALAFVAAILWLGLLPSGRAFAEPGRLAAEARAYAARHGFPVRVVSAGPAWRRVERVCVPVLRDAWEDFQRCFTAANGSVLLRYALVYPDAPFSRKYDLVGRENKHLGLVVQPGDIYYWARNVNGTHPRWEDHSSAHLNPDALGYSMAVELSDRLPHLRDWLAARAQPSDTEWLQGNCMDWLPNAEVAPGRGLFHELGISRSRDGANMRAKLLHGANARLSVVGIHVRDLAEFQALPEAQLLGPPPAGGIDDAVR